MEKNNACGGIRGGVEGDLSAWDWLWGRPCATACEGTVCECFEIVGRQVGEDAWVGDASLEDVDAEEKDPERA